MPAGNKVDAKPYEEVTILFSDIVNFSVIARKCAVPQAPSLAAWWQHPSGCTGAGQPQTATHDASLLLYRMVPDCCPLQVNSARNLRHAQRALCAPERSRSMHTEQKTFLCHHSAAICAISQSD